MRHLWNTSDLRARSRRGAMCAVTSLIVCALLASCSVFDSSEGSGFGSAKNAAEAFDPQDLPAVDPWDETDGVCRILLVGDSLVEASLDAQADAFDYMGCEAVVDGLAARSLSDGWQCLADGGASMAIILRAAPEAGNPTCRPSGLELLRQWSELTPFASATVIALGTNDAGMYDEKGWIRRWTRAVDLTRGPLVFVTVGARPDDRWVDNAARYNDELRRWCPSEPRCVLAEWDLTEPARDPSSYVDHVHLTRAAGEMRSVFIAVAARRAAIPSVGGPRRWRAPEIIRPAGATSTSFASPPTAQVPDLPTVPQGSTSIPPATGPSLPSSSIATTSTTSTTSTSISPGSPSSPPSPTGP